jgi:hypothetical protein
MTDVEAPTFTQMLGEIVDLSAGLGVAFMPALLLAIPGIVLVVVPVLVLLAVAAVPVVLAAALLAPPYLLVRRTLRA